MRDSGLARAMAMAAQLGFAIACPMVFFIGGGAWLDNKLGWSPWLLFAGIVLGVLISGGLFYQIATLPVRKRKDPGEDSAPYKVEQGKDKVKDVGTPRADKWKSNGH
jgi:hypothetical protein